MELSPAQFISSNELIKMRDYARARLNEAFDYVQKKAALSKDYLILVVDKYSA